MSKLKIEKARWSELSAAALPCSSRSITPSWSPFGVTESGHRDLRGACRPPSEADRGPSVIEGGLHKSDFSRADLIHLRLREFSIRDSVCRKAVFEDLSFNGEVINTAFEDTSFLLTGMSGRWTGVSFVRCRFRRSWFSQDAVLSNCVFDSCKFGKMEFQAVELRDVEFRGDVQGVEFSPLKRVPLDRDAGMLPRHISASFRDARLKNCSFVRGVDLRNITFPTSQSWVIVRRARAVVPGLMRRLQEEDPANTREYGRLEYMLPTSVAQADVVYMRDDLLEDYGQVAGEHIWQVLSSVGEVHLAP